MKYLKMVQSLAIKIENEDPKLEMQKNQKLRNLIEDKFSKRIEI